MITLKHMLKTIIISNDDEEESKPRFGEESSCFGLNNYGENLNYKFQQNGARSIQHFVSYKQRIKKLNVMNIKEN